MSSKTTEDMAYWAQKTALMWQIAFLLSVSSLLFSCKNDIPKEILPYYNTPNFTPLFISDSKSVSAKVPHQIADFSFKNQRGETITQTAIEGKIHIADFFFTSCGSICPVMTTNMKKVDSVFNADKNIVLLSYSVTPWIDSVNILKKYAERYQITNPNWHLLTGSKAEIYKLARQSYFAEEDLGFTKDSTNFLHTEHFLLIDKSKRIRGIYNGTLDLEMIQLIKDVKALREER
jgi:protein SCO1/2